MKPLIKPLGRGSVPLGLLAVGAARSIGTMADRVALRLVITALKLIVTPALTLIFYLCLALDPLATAMAVLCMALPTAATSYVIARVMVGDAPLMAAMTSTQHFLQCLACGCRCYY